MNLRKLQLVYLKGKISTGASWSISKIHITAIKHLKTSAWMPFQAKTLMFMIFSLCILKLVQTCNHLLQAPTGKHEFSISVDVFQSVVRCFNYIFLIRPHDKQHLFNFFYFLQKLSNFSPYSTWKVFFKNIQFPSNVNVLQHSRVPLRRPDLFRYWYKI